MKAVACIESEGLSTLTTVAEGFIQPSTPMQFVREDVKAPQNRKLVPKV